MRYTSAIVAGGIAATSQLLSPAQAGMLLSDNTNIGDVVPAGTTRLTTGATYSYLYGVTGNVRGNTDAGIVNNDPSATKLKDGYSENVGGSASVYGSWSGGTGTGSGNAPYAANVATIVVDLKNIYTLDSAALSARFDSTSGYKQGVGTFEIWTSTDGATYTQAGTWHDPSPVYQTTGVVNRNAILNITLPDMQARYVMFYLSRSSDTTASHPTSTQMVLGELMVYGNPIPEPATLALLAAPLLILRRHMVK